MLNDVTKNPRVQEFLSAYSKHRWRDCLESAVLFGILHIQKQYPEGLPPAKLRKPTVKTQTSPYPQRIMRVQSKIKKAVERDIKAFKKDPCKQLALKETKEPSTCPLETALTFIKSPRRALSPGHTRVIQLADEFLSHPVTSYLLRTGE